MGGPKAAVPTKNYSIRLGQTIFSLWSASKDMYASSSAKYSKFKLCQSDFAEHLLKFHTETGCSLCCGDAYISKFRNVGVQTDKEECKCKSMEQRWRDDVCDPKGPTNRKPVQRHLDCANFTMYPEQLHNCRKLLREQHLSLPTLHDSRPDDNLGEKKDLRDEEEEEEDFDDTETLTASEGGSEDESEVSPVSNTNLGSVGGNTGPSVNANCVQLLERRIQKQRDSVEGIISKIKQKIMGEEEEVVTVAAKTEGKNLQHSKNGIGFHGNVERTEERNEDDLITALYSMAAGSDVQYPETTSRHQRYPAQGMRDTMATDQVKEEEERCDATSGRSTSWEGLSRVPPQQQDCIPTMELLCGSELYAKVEENIEEEQQATEEMDVFQNANDVLKMDTGQEVISQELQEKKLKRLDAVSNLDEMFSRPIKMSKKKKHHSHRLDMKLAKLPRLYECKMCCHRFQKSTEMISHYAREHPNQLADSVPGREGNVSDVVTASNTFPVLDVNQIATKLRQCKHCKEYVDDVKAHRRIHSVKRFTCDVCGKGFVFRSSLRKHQMCHNSQRRSLQFHKCEMCDRTFTDKMSLDAHVFSTHQPHS
ncbi:zinc finger protein 35-like [Patiria miniata]|uniref:C2H2-type domain-containing protein n=1 Tax=Patiria miniata TaxID=46514 RepID=A0A914BBP9_PATMI|nr:zinc finger protein 35-like [Patiria miniata]XP_038073455.1 zinc finger protein 35-like [Patiria miniata]XP_038073456.1 zinc finger protein 35-like [Patiria miniata]XP_038073457.1 zinc finger protein 35-like [Patiria miniata]